MKIAFKQAEIVAGLKLYIQAQGISLAGKSVGVEFTAGRKEGGLTAEVEILSEDIAAELAALGATVNSEGIQANTTTAGVAPEDNLAATETVTAEPEVTTASDVVAADPAEGVDTTGVDPSTLGNKPSLFA